MPPNKEMSVRTFERRSSTGGGIPSCPIVGWRAGSRALKSTGDPKKATPEGTPTFFPVLLTALDPWLPS